MMRRPLLLGLLLVPYVLYLAYIMQAGHGAVDYETFIDIGHRFRAGQEAWGENSYYPMPYVLVFAAFDALPRALSILIWHAAPVLAALAVTNGSPWTLLFAPLFAHFVGGQTAIVGLVGLWGYRKYSEQVCGGAWLALLTFKPQLAIFPTVWAGVQWLRHRELRRQALVWLATVSAIYLPTFLIQPDWIGHWLQSPRPISERALAGILPRGLFVFAPQVLFWPGVVLGGAALLWLMRRRLTFDRFLLWSFIVSPLGHDYDLIQLIPLLGGR